MIWIWWPSFAVPVLMVIMGLAWRLIRCLPYRRKEELTEEQLQTAREIFSHSLWQLGLVFCALCFMLMRSVRLLESLPQQILVAVITVLELLGLLLVEPAVRRGLKEKYGNALPDRKEEQR